VALYIIVVMRLCGQKTRFATISAAIQEEAQALVINPAGSRGTLTQQGSRDRHISHHGHHDHVTWELVDNRCKYERRNDIYEGQKLLRYFSPFVVNSS
jgi:hypothetical protein